MSSVFNIMSYHRFFDWGTSQSAHKLFILQTVRKFPEYYVVLL